ncbi:hypothetical protein ACLB1T_12750 [Escherichia coli]
MRWRASSGCVTYSLRRTVQRFSDDHPYPFKVNPQFKAWVPVTQVPNCWLLVDGVNKPKNCGSIWPVDYWHNVEPLPTSFWTEDVEVIAPPESRWHW